MLRSMNVPAEILLQDTVPFKRKKRVSWHLNTEDGVHLALL